MWPPSINKKGNVKDKRTTYERVYVFIVVHFFDKHVEIIDYKWKKPFSCGIIQGSPSHDLSLSGSCLRLWSPLFTSHLTLLFYCSLLCLFAYLLWAHSPFGDVCLSKVSSCLFTTLPNFWLMVFPSLSCLPIAIGSLWSSFRDKGLLGSKTLFGLVVSFFHFLNVVLQFY